MLCSSVLAVLVCVWLHRAGFVIFGYTVRRSRERNLTKSVIAVLFEIFFCEP